MQLSQIIQEYMGGTSGALYSAMTLTASEVCYKNRQLFTINTYNYIALWCDILKSCIERIKIFGNVKLGDRTMLGKMRFK